MSGYNKKPAIRFQGFTDVWEQRKLSDEFIDFIGCVPPPLLEIYDDDNDGDDANNII